MPCSTALCHPVQDAQLQKKLQQVLKLNKEKWEEARDHALKAVVVDNRMRVWWAAHPGGSSSRIGANIKLRQLSDTNGQQHASSYKASRLQAYNSFFM